MLAIRPWEARLARRGRNAMASHRSPEWAGPVGWGRWGYARNVRVLDTHGSP
jgi:hypothetical protein